MPAVGGKLAQAFWPISIRDGVVFGRSVRPTERGDAGPFVAAPGGRVALPTQVPPRTEESVHMTDAAVHINDDGTVIGGRAVGDKGLIQAVRWRCTKVV